MDELLSEFLTETAESLTVIDVELVEFERNPDNREILGNIFRLLHTIKGTCGFLGLSRLEQVAHAGENVLGRFRDGQLSVTPAAVTLILHCIDLIRQMLTDLEASGEEPADDHSDFIAQLNAVAEGREIEPVAAASKAEASVAESLANTDCLNDDKAFAVSPQGFPVAKELLEEVAKAQAQEHHDPEPAPSMTSTVPASPKTTADAPVASAAPAATSSPAPAAPPAPVNAADPAAKGKPAGEAAEVRDPSVAQQSIRVPVETLEAMMTLVSELVLTRNQLLQMVRGRSSSEFSGPLQRLSQITSELQEGVMKTRMQPIGNAWSKLPRIIRDLSVETGKKLDLRMNGADTELDRQVLEMIRDPLTHMVRNSADHGIEGPAQRRAAGKPETGVIKLDAYHEGGHIIIKIADDGRGLDTDRIRQKIVAQGLAGEAEVAAMTPHQVHSYIFRAGFSTAEKVTNVSGRGVGMDVVRTNIERIGGTIEMDSVAGKGSTFTIKIPLTLAIVSALIIGSAGIRFAVPQISVIELVRVTESGTMRVEMMNTSPLLRLRDRLLPLVNLRSILKIGDTNGIPGHDGTGETKEAFVVVMQVGNVRFGIIVDEVFDTEEIVVKPVSPMLRSIPYYAGNTILGDGSVIMILDPNGISGVLGHSTTSQESVIDDDNHASDTSKVRLLLFRAGEDGVKAVPLELVARLESVNLANVELSQGRSMIQYRGHLMPLIPCSGASSASGEGQRPVLVFSEGVRTMGLMVDEIVDIVEEYLDMEVATIKSGVVGSAIICGRATDIIDASHYLTQAYPDWFDTNEGCAFEEETNSRRLLLVDDSSFFRNLLTPVLEAAGYRVTTVGDADQALRLREDGAMFDAIISDIEMPGMNGFEFAESVRRDERWGSTPLVALSSYASDRDLERGRAVGFSDYVAKFDRDGLMASLASSVAINGYRH